MDSRPVFALITSKTCPGCMHFKNKTWPSLKKELEKRNRVQIVHVEVPTNKSKPDPVKYHKDLARFVGWFPTMSLHPAERWYDHNSELVGIVKNGKMLPPGKDENGNDKPERVDLIGTPNLSENDILNWVDYTLDKPDGMFSRYNKGVKSTEGVKSFKRGNNNPEDKIIILNGGNNMRRLPNGKYMVPTSGHYINFEPSKAN